MINNYLNKNDFLLILIPIVILLPVLSYPITLDVSIFLCGGRTIAEGGIIYQDFIDLKPPLIYYIFSIIYSIFGWGEHNVRIFDYIFQVFFVFSLFYVILKTIEDRKIAILAVIIYSIVYTSIGPGSTFQGEGMALLPMVWALLLRINGKNKSSLIYEGLLYGIATSFKYTIGFILVAAMIHIFYDNSNRIKYLKSNFLLISGFAFGILLCHIPLIFDSIRSGYFEVLNWTFMYADIPALNAAFLKNIIKSTEFFFSSFYSYIFTFSMLIGVFLIFSTKLGSKYKSLFIYSWLIVAFSMIGIIIERKFFIYHYQRFYVGSVILSGAGLVYIFEIIKNNLRIKSIVLKTVIITLVFGGLLYSPIIRWVYLLRVPYTYLINKTDEYNHVFDSDEVKVTRHDLLEAGNYIKSNMKLGDLVIILPINSHQIYQICDIPDYSSFAHSCYITDPEKHPIWNSKLISEFQHAKWLVFEETENLKLFIGEEGTTLDFLKKNPPINTIITNEFEISKRVNNLVIYSRKQINSNS